MTIRVRTGALVESLEARRLLSGTYTVFNTPEFVETAPFQNYYIKLAPTSPPLTIDDGLGDITYEDLLDPAYLDTGTSGIILDQGTVQEMGIKSQSFNGQPVQFGDIGVAGSEPFGVSQPLYMGLAPWNLDSVDPTSLDLTPYTQTYGLGPAPANAPLYAEVNPFSTADPNDPFNLLPPTNIVGMPVMEGKVVVMDPKPYLDPNSDNPDMNTYIYNPGTPYSSSTAASSPGIPPTNLHVRLTYANFAPYTTLSPLGAQGPTFAPNPIIGPNPLSQLDPSIQPGNVPPVSVSLGGFSTTGSFLFDTGSPFIFISQAEAAKLHVSIKAGTEGSANPVLLDDNGNNVTVDVQQITGLDGTIVNVPFFNIDSLTLQTIEGTQIVVKNIAIGVQDITIQDPNTGNTLTLDGDFGTNTFFGTDVTQTVPAFNFVTFDQPHGLLGFDATGAVKPGAASIAGRFVFYNDSSFDGNNPAANVADDQAVATNKQALLPGQTATVANFTSYSKGINGIMVDVTGLTGTPTASDFTFLEGNTNTPSQWTAAPAPSAVLVRPGAGINGSTRIEITWPDGAIRNQWLQITMAADANTGLASPDVFYFGNLIGSSGSAAVNGAFTVTSADQAAVQADPHGFLSPAPVTDMNDFNRDGRVDATDLLIARYDIGKSLIVLSTTSLAASSTAASAALKPATQTASRIFLPTLFKTPAQIVSHAAHIRPAAHLLDHPSRPLTLQSILDSQPLKKHVDKKPGAGKKR